MGAGNKSCSSVPAAFLGLFSSAAAPPSNETPAKQLAAAARAPTARPPPSLACRRCCSLLLQKKAENCDVVAEKGNEVEVHYLVSECSSRVPPLQQWRDAHRVPGGRTRALETAALLLPTHPHCRDHRLSAGHPGGRHQV